MQSVTVRPPDLAKARRTLRSGCFSAELSSGMKNRMAKGAAEISSVAMIALNQTEDLPT